MTDFIRDIIINFKSNIKEIILKPLGNVKKQIGVINKTGKEFGDIFNGGKFKNNIKKIRNEINELNKDFVKALSAKDLKIKGERFDKYVKLITSKKRQLKLIDENSIKYDIYINSIENIQSSMDNMIEKYGNLNEIYKIPTKESINEEINSLNSSLGDIQTKLSALSKSWAIFAAAAVGAMAWVMASTPALNAQMSLIKIQFELLGMAIGNELMPYLQPIINAFSDLLNWFINLDPVVLEFVGLIIGLSFALVTLISVLGSLYAIFLLLSATPIVLVIFGIIVAVAAVIILFKYWNEIIQKLTEKFKNLSIFGKIVAIVIAAITLPVWFAIVAIIAIIKAIEYLIKVLMSTDWDAVWKKFGDFFTNIGNYFSEMGKKIVDIGEDIKNFFIGMGDDISNIWEIIKNIFTINENGNNGNSITSAFDDININVVAAMNNMSIKVKDIFIKLFDDITKKIDDLLTNIGEFTSSIQDIFNNLFSGEVTLADTIKNLLSFMLKTFMNNLNNFIITPINNMIDLINDYSGLKISKLNSYSTSGTNSDTYSGGTSTVRGYALGTAGLPKDMVIQAHKGEIIVPPSASQQVRSGRAFIGSGKGGISGSTTIISPIFNMTVYSNSTNVDEVAELASKKIIRKMERLVSR